MMFRLLILANYRHYYSSVDLLYSLDYSHYCFQKLSIKKCRTQFWKLNKLATPPVDLYLRRQTVYFFSHNDVLKNLMKN